MKMRFLFVTLLCLVALGFAQTPKGGLWCYNPYPFYCDGDLCCGCQLVPNDGWCVCTGNSQCTEQKECPTSCQNGAVVTDEEREIIRKSVSKHPDTVLVFIAKECYDGAVGKAWLDEATRQEKAIRFFVTPKNMTQEQMEQYNRHILQIQEDAARAEHAKKKTGPDQ